MILWQQRALVRTLRHAVASVPFYRDLRIEPASIASAADLQRFPIITKADLQADAARFLADGADPHALHSSRTSGSTGEPTVTYFDDHAWALCKYALKVRRLLAHCNPFFKRAVTFTLQAPATTGGRSSDEQLSFGRVFSETRVSVFDDIEEQLAVLDRVQPHIVQCSPSQLGEIAQYCEQRSRPAPQVMHIFTTSELLTRTLRTRIEAAFGATVIDVYGSTEFKEIAVQCRDARYHLNFESCYVETLRDADSDPLGPSRLIVTALANRAMPLIRYDIGDYGSLVGGGCTCGRNSPTLERLEGRQVDTFVTPSGKRISQYVLEGLVESLPGLNRYRLVHEAPEKLRVEYEAAAPLDAEIIAGSIAALHRHLGESMTIYFAQMPKIERTAGKHRLYVRAW